MNLRYIEHICTLNPHLEALLAPSLVALTSSVSNFGTPDPPRKGMGRDGLAPLDGKMEEYVRKNGGDEEEMAGR